MTDGNRLRHETSPYLLQHSANPVDWYPWGEEAFRTARERDKPVFLSIGYSTCHWCHVMAHESFEDEAVAALMNETFVAVKVDREEHPEIDGIYMKVCSIMTGSAGWPLTIIMTPEKSPFFAATYIPRESRFGRVGMLELVPRIARLWVDRREEVMRSAAGIAAAVEQLAGPGGAGKLDPTALSRARDRLVGEFDARYGGFGQAPKFPMAHNLLFLLRQWNRTGDRRYLEMVETSLRAMRMGGIYDQVGFGFHRYSTDRHWLVPHFEKMLYDQALLMLAYVEAFQATGNPEYKRTAEETAAYVLRDMTSPLGGFYSAEDADSEGEEGKFYLWKESEIRQILGERAEPVLSFFDIKSEGNFIDQMKGARTGRNVLHMTSAMDCWARLAGQSPETAASVLDAARAELYSHREKRVRPFKDDKILTDWNGLMIAALARAGSVLDRSDCLAAAGRAARFIRENMRKADGSLLHTFRDGRARIAGNLDDYAFFVWGLIELYQATFDVEHLRAALEINGEMSARFEDKEGGGFYFTAEGEEKVLVRRKEAYDGAVPSGNSVAMLNLLRLGRLTGQAGLESLAARVGGAFARRVEDTPLAHTFLLLALDFAVGPAHEVVIAGRPRGRDTQSMLKALRSGYLPNVVVLVRPNEEKPAIERLAPFVAGHVTVDGRATAYVCSNYACRQPTTDPKEMLEFLGLTSK